MKNRPYRIEVPGLRVRTATNLRGAKVAMGRLMVQSPNGTIGHITRDGEIVITGECGTLGWMER